MNFKTDRIKIYAAIIILVQILLLAVSQSLLQTEFSYMAMLFTVVDGACMAIIIYIYEIGKHQRDISISRVLGTDAKDALLYGRVGIVVYDDDYVITWASELFDQQQISLIGEKFTKVIPGSEIMFNGTVDTAVFEMEGRKFEFTRHDDEQMMLVRDITEQLDLTNRYMNEQLVLGLVHLDNYDETIQYEDEQKIALINSNIRQKVIEWAKENHGLIRRLRGDHFLLVLDQQHFQDMLKDRFSILETVKSEAAVLDVAITASMVFAYGCSDILQLDSLISEAMELVLARGGDQVAVKEYGKEVAFYGHSSESTEKNSKVRVRVAVQSLNNIIKTSSEVFIVPHKEADFDALGAAMAASVLVQESGKNAYIVAKGITIEPKAMEIFSLNTDSILTRHNIISENDAIAMLDKDSTVIAVDHHSMDLTAAPELLNQSKRIIVIDHHRRKSETNILAMMIYNEPSSSSTVELMSEILSYQPKTIELDELDATYMYTGILLDTDNLKVRCNSRTFEVCSWLKKQGASTSLANDWLKDSFEDFISRTEMMKNCEVLNGNILVATQYESGKFVTRTAISKTANYMCSIKDVNAAFVIAQLDENTWAVSGRSNETVNVQIILEKLGGGGHYNAAGLQRDNTNGQQLHDELLAVIDEYQQGDRENESNLIK